MFDDTLDLAENKLLLLYIFRKLKFPVSKNVINEIILENNFINYFMLQQYIIELISSNFLKYSGKEEDQRLELTKRGNKVLSLFETRISEKKKQVIDDYLNKNNKHIKNEISVTADYTIENNNNFIVNLKAFENTTALIDIKLSVASNNQAKTLCSKWKNNSSELYTKIINLLITD